MRWPGGAALLAFAAASPLHAQASDLPTDRVGPGRATPVLPAYTTSPPAETPRLPEPGTSPASGGELLVREVYVGGEAGAYPARPAAKWAPPAPDPSGLKLVHARGAPLDAGWIRRQFAANGMIGAAVGYDRIAALLQLINRAYLANGYINSGIVLPPQPLEAGDGLLRLELVSGHLVASPGGQPVTVAWKDGRARGLTAGYVRRRLAAARADPLDIATLERDFRLLADDPAITTVNADLRPSERRGEASLLVTVAPPPRLDLYTSYANSRSPSVGGNRVGFGGSLRNLLAPGSVLSAEVGSTRGLTDFTSGFTAPLGDPALSFQLRGGFDNAAVIDRPLVPLDIRSREWSFEGGLTGTLLARPLTPIDAAGTLAPAENLAIGLLVAHHHLESDLLGVPFSFSPGSDNGRTEYSALRLTADYTRRSIDTVLALSFTASLGLAGTRPDDRSIAHPNPMFRSALVQANFAHRLTAHQLELRLRFAGQLSSGLLYSSERFTLGGADTVRGYRENLLLADEAVVGSAELAQPFSLRGRAGAGRPDWTSFTLSVFADGGYVHNRIAPQPVPTTIESLGVGLAWTPAPWLSGWLTYGRALNHIDAPGRRDLQDRGFQFQIVLRPLALLGLGRS